MVISILFTTCLTKNSLKLDSSHWGGKTWRWSGSQVTVGDIMLSHKNCIHAYKLMHGKLKCFLSCLPLWMINMTEIKFNLFISVQIKQLQSQLLLYLAHRVVLLQLLNASYFSACHCLTWKSDGFLLVRQWELVLLAPDAGDLVLPGHPRKVEEKGQHVVSPVGSVCSCWSMVMILKTFHCEMNAQISV